ncbi:serine/threonine-protein kinase [Arenimonas oryziterrae]|uniref:Protein kinase domain-containing protein n=1 Tax=Arenimonas oryziterrae DSM 21050 = YC6267 TaxID=1121015 RepID=A0A091AXE5_9GAMM|nr:serine/threonine-protein kinase [Arenimonas oryziterrae]KFN44958.1 hypothetical protein N789_02765 [Arenimonas oryziterrae DSM 21050 = YC6267]
MTDSGKTDIGALLREAMTHAGEARERWLRELATRSPDEAATLRHLLHHDAPAATQVLGDGALPPGGTLGPSEGGRIGPYRLLRRLGQGGMGEVWLAERADEAFSKQVAIKFIGTFLGNREAIAWFRRERQALARLEHPHIARLLDGGETPDGRPFLVMEYVDGVPLDLYADGLPVERILELFLQVCAAVEHAHRALIVHRDIKPANVLVAGEGETKLLDFGIAKEMETGDQGDDGRTKTQAFTLHYASPEQMDGRPITVASDIYSLGALLYRLLSGQLPHAQSTSALAQLQAIEKTGPERPSRAALASTRLAESERKRLSRRLHGDLDDIVLKCLRREPNLRYGSARELAEDLRRYQAHEPVLARRGSVGYRTARWLRRHWLAVGAAAAVMLALGGGLLSTHWQAQEAEKQRALAQRRFDLSRGLVKDVLFDFQDRLANVPGTIDARRQLVDRTKTYLQQLASDAQDDPDLLADLAIVERRLGDISGNPLQPNIGDTVSARLHFQRAEDLIRRALALRPKDDRLQLELARALAARGAFAFWDNDLPASEKAYRAALPILDRARAHQRTAAIQREYATAVIGLGDVQFWNSELEKSLATYDCVCPDIVAAARSDDSMRDTAAICHTRRADALAWLERYDEAEREIAEALTIWAAQSAAHPDDVYLAHAYQVSLMKQGEILLWSHKDQAALAAYARGLAIAERVTQADPNDLRAARDLALMHNKRGDALLSLERRNEAIADYRAGLEGYRRLRDGDPTQTEHQRDFAATNKRLGVALLENGQGDSAVPYLDAAIDTARQRWQASPGTVSARRDLAVALEDRVLAPATSGQRCAWIAESLGLWQQIEKAGKLAPTDRPQLSQARERDQACRRESPLPSGPAAATPASP